MGWAGWVECPVCRRAYPDRRAGRKRKRRSDGKSFACSHKTKSFRGGPQPAALAGREEIVSKQINAHRREKTTLVPDCGQGKAVEAPWRAAGERRGLRYNTRDGRQ